MAAYRGLNLVFEYVIKFDDDDDTYYTGCSGTQYKGQRHQAFPYTQAGAIAKIERMGWKATVIHS